MPRASFSHSVRDAMILNCLCAASIPCLLNRSENSIPTATTPTIETGARTQIERLLGKQTLIPQIQDQRVAQAGSLEQKADSLETRTKEVDLTRFDRDITSTVRPAENHCPHHYTEKHSW